MLPFFIMHTCVFILIPPTDDIESTVAAALAPFDESLEVEPYRVHLDHGDVVRMAGHYNIDPANLHALVKKLPDWTRREGGVDRDGLYYLSTCNPDGHFDWYEIGGRWNGHIPGSQRNVILAGTLAGSRALGRCLPYYVLTPEGDWLEHERFYFSADWKDVQKVALKKGEWLRIVRDTLRRWPKHQVVCVDIHS